MDRSIPSAFEIAPQLADQMCREHPELAKRRLDEMQRRWLTYSAQKATAAADTERDAADSIPDRVDRVIGDLLGGRVAPKQVDRVAEAAEKAKNAHAVGRAIRTGN